MGTSIQLDLPKLTPVVRALLIAIVVVFIGQLVAAAALDFDAAQLQRNVTTVFGLYAPNLFRGYVWQPLTYAFLHATDGFGHVLVNALMLYLFGSRVEGLLSRKRFVALYVGAAVAGAFAVLCSDAVLAALGHGRASLVTGASGAVAGVLAAFCWLHWNRWLSLFFVKLQGKHFLALIVFIDVLRALGSNVSLAAHLGGTAFGLLYMSGWIDPRMWWLKWQHRRARSRLKVVQGGAEKKDWMN